MAKRLSLTSVIVMALMVIAATAAGGFSVSSPEFQALGASTPSFGHLGHAAGHLQRRARILDAAAARVFGAKQSAACIQTCAQACVDSSSPCGASCAQACATGCVPICASGGSASGGPTASPEQARQARCEAAQVSPAAQAILMQCGTLSTDREVLFDLGNHSDAARVEVDRMCSAGCIGAWNAALSQYSECFGAAELEAWTVVTSTCALESGVPCAWRLRAVDQLTACDDRESSLGRATCEASTVTNRFCKWVDDACVLQAPVALLQQACTVCFDRFVFLIPRVYAEADDSQAERLALLELQTTVVAQKNHYCAKSNDVWCGPMLATIDPRIMKIDRSNNVSLDVIRANVSNICTADGKVCVNKQAGSFAALATLRMGYAYRECMMNATRFTNAQTRAYDEYVCLATFRGTFDAVAEAQVQLAFMCRRNERDEACLPLAQQFVRHSCIATLNARPPVCNSTCATWVQNQTVTLGCCWDRFAELSFESQYPDTAVLPAAIAATFDRAPAGGRNYTHNPGFQYVEACANTTGFNATAGRAQVAAMCPVVAAVRKELTLVGVRWSRIESNATLKRAMEEALRSDMARSLGVAASAIVNGTLVADSSQSLTVGASANTSSAASASASVAASGAARRQQTAATSGTKFKFDLQLDSAAETTAAATRYETAKSSGQLQVTSTATVVSSQCTDCVGSPTAAPGQTAAPPPTGNLFAAIVGSPTDGSSAGSSSTSGSAATTAVAAFVAAAAAVAAALA